MLQQVQDVSILALAGDLDFYEGRLLMQKIRNLLKDHWP